MNPEIILGLEVDGFGYALFDTSSQKFKPGDADLGQLPPDLLTYLKAHPSAKITVMVDGFQEETP